MANIYLPFPPRLAYVLPSISAESGIYITFHFRTEWHIYYLPFPYRLALFYLTFPPRVAYTSLTYPFRVVYILPYISVQDGLYFTFHFRPDWHIFYLPFPSRVIHILLYISLQSGIYIALHFRTYICAEWHIFCLAFPYRVADILPYISVQTGIYFYPTFPSRVKLTYTRYFEVFSLQSDACDHKTGFIFV